MPDMLQKVEEKVLLLLKEIQGMRKEIRELRQENLLLKNSQGNHLQKLQGLVSLLDVLDTENELVTY
jgi:regulator of replication initiation timing